MHDAVADVLAERAALGTGRAVAVTLSVVMHGGISALAIWSALHHAPVQTVSVLNIRLAAPKQMSQPITPRSVTKPAPPKPPRIEEPKPEPIKPAPVTATAPPIKNTAPPSPFGRSTKKPSDTPAPPPTPTSTQPAVTSTAPPIPVGGTGITAFEGGEFPYPLYVEGMLRKIGNYWWIRPTAAPGITAVIYFRIARDGTISDAKVIASSGNSTFDRAALSAVRSASPLNTLPFGYSEKYLGVQQTFR
ncbi:MAG TPA: TonB family protein [Thermoanaerobaculia bacterium]|nr:TonB family protein [Thermoanaerobaculia bacterium]